MYAVVQCYTKLGAFNEAQKDAEKCLEIDPTFVKGYTRKAAVEFFTKQYDKALETYKTGLTFDPEVSSNALRAKSRIETHHNTYTRCAIV